MDEAQIWNLAISTGAVIVVAVIGWVNTQRAANKAGVNSDAALARTIEADREARILERRFDLYADLLTHVFERKEGRDVVVTAIKVNGWEPYNPYKPEEIYRLTGRARAIAETSVLDAFNASNDASGEVIRDWNYLQMFQGDPQWGARWATMFEKKEQADKADFALEVAIRTALHRDAQSADARLAPASPENATVASESES